MKNINFDRNSRRKLRVSKNIFGSAQKPRISVFRSNKTIYAQAIDDQAKKTLFFSSSLKVKKDKKTVLARIVGQELAKKLLDKGIKKAVFDRGKYAYKGRVKALAEGLREGGLQI